MVVTCTARMKTYVVTLLTMVVIMGPLVIMGAHADTPQIQFIHGVASGDVTSESAVLWSQTDKDSSLNVQVSKHPNFKKLDFEDSVHATVDSDFTAKSLAEGLKPNTLYYYRFTAGSTTSEIGTFKTSPLEDKKADAHFTWSGDTDVSKINGNRYFGDWLSLNAIRSENPDFFIYLGDTIYSDRRATGLVPDAQTLGDFRQIYKESRDVPALHDLLKSTSVYPAWDDHEVRNDWAGQTVDSSFFQIGKRSFNEYMPIGQLHSTSDPDCAGPTQFRVKHWGKDVDLIILDTRTCRSANVETQCQADQVPTLPAQIRTSLGLPAQPPVGCLAAINDPDRTMLGTEQKGLFEDALLNSKAKFKFVVTSVSIQQTFVLPYDGWEGYGAERSEILNFIRDNEIKNVIFLTTDLHLNLMNKVYTNLFTDTTPVSYEVVTGPIGAETDKARIIRFSEGIGADPKPFLQARELLFTIAGADCRNIDTYSYGSVSFSRFSGAVTITLKDQNGNTIHDDLNPSIECKKSFGPIDFPESASQINDANKMSAHIEKPIELWKDLQGEKSTLIKGILNLGDEMSGFKNDPFAQKKYN
ncbi:MAG TPA: alkaline phosphatase D family protein [Nitrososphaeraceae archaeon]|nr:alkaline phosphatase D family protein [Nitrososphaeraceae archaeon]